MKKEKLKRIKNMPASKEIQRKVREDKGENVSTDYGYMSWNKKNTYCRKYKYYRFYEAKVQDGILAVNIYVRSEIAAGSRQPVFVTYIDKAKEEWMTLEVKTGRWLTAMISNLPFEREKGEGWECLGWSTGKTKEVINEYLNVEGNPEPKKAIREFQTNKKKDLLQKKHSSELEQIDEVMNEVPDLPKDFNKWTFNFGYKTDASIIMRPGKITEGICTRCQKMVRLPKKKPKHLQEGTCPNCRAKVTYRSFNMQQIIRDSKKIGIIQELKDNTGHILRIFNTELEYRKADDYKVARKYCNEQFRFRLDKYFRAVEIFEWGEYRYTGKIRWCHELNHGMGYSYYYNSASTYCALYDRNIDKILEKTDGRYVPLKKLLKKHVGERIHPDGALNVCIREPRIEMFMKMGLENLSLKMLKEGTSRMNELVWQCDRIEDILRLDMQRVRQAVRLDASQKELEVLQAAKLEQINLSDEMVRKIARYYKYRGKDDICIVVGRNNLEKMIHYLDKIAKENKDEEPEIIARDYEDYLEQLDRLGIPKDKHNRFPANFNHAHEELSEIIREKESYLRAAETRVKNRELKRVVKELEKMFYLKSKKYMIVWPQSKADFQKEGQKQHNCVWGYFDKCAGGMTVVFFLRKKEEPNKPYCTVEFNNDGELAQCRTIYNGTAGDEAMKCMEKIKENFQKERLKRELDNSAELQAEAV